MFQNMGNGPKITAKLTLLEKLRAALSHSFLPKVFSDHNTFSSPVEFFNNTLSFVLDSTNGWYLKVKRFSMGP